VARRWGHGAVAAQESGRGGREETAAASAEETVGGEKRLRIIDGSSFLIRLLIVDVGIW